MTQQDKLFVFIQSLTRAEKSYFTKYARLNAVKEKPDYLLLFDYLSEARSYDEAALKKHFKGEKFISQLSRKKTQLKDKIIESLSHYHANHTVEASLRLQMNVLPALYEKASQNKVLLKEFENQIKTIKKVAEEEECFGVLVDVFSWERQLIKLQDSKKHDDNVLSLVESYKKSQDSLGKEQVLEVMFIQIEMILLKDPKIKHSKNREQYEKFINSPLMDFEPSKLSKKAQRYFFYIKSSYHSYMLNWSSAHEAVENLINTYSVSDTTNPVVLKEYKKHLCRYLVVSTHAQKFDNYLGIIHKLEAISSSEDDIRMFNTINSKVLSYYLNVQNFEEAISVSKKIEKRWDDLCVIIPKRIQLAYCYNITLAYWFGKKTDTAIYWLSKILNFELIAQGQRYITLARIIQFPIYYDNGYEIDNRIESTRKVLSKRKELNEYRQAILSGFRRLIRCVSKQDKKNCIIDIHDTLSEMKKSHNIQAGELDCILLWCNLNVEKNQLSRVKQLS